VLIPHYEAVKAVRTLLAYLGEDPEREGLRETPERVLRGYGEMLRGYRVDVSTLFKTFEDGACDELVLLRDIPFDSLCEHHILPFSGVAHIAYIPDGKVIGVSKLARVLDAYAQRLQIQERLCVQVTRALDDHLEPLGSACILEATHSCMSCRGVRKSGSVMVTSSLTGIFRDDPAARSELLRLIGK
jgi:GTP cyclohydrolase I